jgi:chaperonin GroEL
MKYLKDKIEDAVNATKAAIAEGIVPGGGAALAKVAAKLAKNVDRISNTQGDEFAVGYSILVGALTAPFKQIVQNAGREDGMVLLAQISHANNAGLQCCDRRNSRHDRGRRH